MAVYLLAPSKVHRQTFRFRVPRVSNINEPDRPQRYDRRHRIQDKQRKKEPLAKATIEVGKKKVWFEHIDGYNVRQRLQQSLGRPMKDPGVQKVLLLRSLSQADQILALYSGPVV